MVYIPDQKAGKETQSYVSFLQSIDIKAILINVRIQGKFT